MYREHSNIWESQLVEISGGIIAKKNILGNYTDLPGILLMIMIYLLESSCFKLFRNLGPEILIAGDFNINLLDVHNREKVGNYFT